MNSSLNALQIRKNLGVKEWSSPTRMTEKPFYLYGDGWVFKSNISGSVIVTTAIFDDVEWIHASISRENRMPTYEDLKLLHKAVFDNGWAYQMFAPVADHVNIHDYALHLWGRLDGKPVLPDFVGSFEKELGFRTI